MVGINGWEGWRGRGGLYSSANRRHTRTIKDLLQLVDRPLNMHTYTHTSIYLHTLTTIHSKKGDATSTKEIHVVVAALFSRAERGRGEVATNLCIQ